jgi:hypothetical protein
MGEFTFGCAVCWPEDAMAAWNSFTAMNIERELIAESHFSIKIRRCNICTQHFVSVFTETIDWIDGDDPQNMRVQPVTESEATTLSAFDVEKLAPGRRSLHWDFPKGGDSRAFWDKGVRIGLHD